MICNGMEETYFKEHINLDTKTITDILSEFLTWLFTTYSDIDRDTMKEEEQKVLSISYNFQDLITDSF